MRTGILLLQTVGSHHDLLDKVLLIQPVEHDVAISAPVLTAILGHKTAATAESLWRVHLMLRCELKGQSCQSFGVDTYLRVLLLLVVRAHLLVHVWCLLGMHHFLRVVVHEVVVGLRLLEEHLLVV